jgi:hypothetical protein
MTHGARILLEVTVVWIVKGIASVSRNPKAYYNNYNSPTTFHPHFTTR